MMNMLVIFYLPFLLGGSLATDQLVKDEVADNMALDETLEAELEELRVKEHAQWLKEEEAEAEGRGTADNEPDLRQTLMGKQISLTCPTTGKRCHALNGDCLGWWNSTRHCELVSHNPVHCGSRNCRCCLDCDKPSLCQRDGGRCIINDKCYPYMFEAMFSRCATDRCRCCKYCRTSPTCRAGTSHGFCVSDPNYYISRYPYYYAYPSARCLTPECSCLKYCVRDSNCAKKNGYCVRREAHCRPGYVKFNCGCRDRINCSCCVPEKAIVSASSFPCTTTG